MSTVDTVVNHPPPTPVNPPSPSPEVQDLFLRARAYMDNKRDKEEEITRLSKDITWESKRIIFQAHRFMVHKNAVNEAKKKLKFLITSDRYFPGLAKALKGEDHSQHYKRYTNSVQEYIEATIFTHFLEHRTIPKYESVRDTLTFQDKEDPSTILCVPLCLNDYILGICDFTGELMKAAVQTLCKWEWHLFLVQSFAMVREVYGQLFGIYTRSREFRKKMNVMRASVMKIEATVYRVKMKVLIYGKVPQDSGEFLTEPVTTRRGGGGGNNHNNKDDENGEYYATSNNNDSGVE